MTLRKNIATMSHDERVNLALFCAKKTVGLNKDQRFLALIDAIDTWVSLPNEENKYRVKDMAKMILTNSWSRECCAISNVAWLLDNA
jgi:hypothetical protein